MDLNENHHENHQENHENMELNIDLSILAVESAEKYHAQAKHHLSSHQLLDFMKCPWLHRKKAIGLMGDACQVRVMEYHPVFAEPRRTQASALSKKSSLPPRATSAIEKTPSTGMHRNHFVIALSKWYWTVRL